MKNDATVLKGTIIKGLGEGAYFMSMGHYKKEIKKKLGFDAYPGTLNIKIKKNQYNIIKKINPIKIAGYINNGKRFGGASCYKAIIKDINGAIIIPDINKHKNGIIEFIAPMHIKSKSKINNGDKIKVELVK